MKQLALRTKPIGRRSRQLAFMAALFLFTSAALAVSNKSNFIEDLTWTEVRDRVANGATTLLVPIGGTEQNGPHMVLGKHNARVHFLSGQIAQRLGNALVAPVIAYVPEGSVNPPTAHMRFAGTISIPDEAFDLMLEATARSFKQHGFKDIVFLGDHGGYQKNAEKIALKLTREWAKAQTSRVHAISDYYKTTQTSYVSALKSKGYSDGEIGIHAGLADTSLALAVDKSLVRTELLGNTALLSKENGVYGNPARASPELGAIGIQLIVQASVAAIQAAVAQQR